VGDQEELGAALVADLLQADGWEVFHVGGGVPEDEILAMVGRVRPQVLVLFATRPEDVPDTRRLVEMIREVGVCPTMNIIVSGGIYNRADGLWQEVGADLFSPSPRELRATLRDLEPRQPHAQRVAVVKKRHRRRKSAATPAAGQGSSAHAAADHGSTTPEPALAGT
jgi:methylmalonyl-CoA mutase cobalamin-binding subunit